MPKVAERKTRTVELWLPRPLFDRINMLAAKRDVKRSKLMIEVLQKAFPEKGEKADVETVDDVETS